MSTINSDTEFDKNIELFCENFKIRKVTLINPREKFKKNPFYWFLLCSFVFVKHYDGTKKYIYNVLINKDLVRYICEFISIPIKKDYYINISIMRLKNLLLSKKIQHLLGNKKY